MSYIPRLGPFFGVQNFKFQYFGFFFFRKINIWGYEDFGDIFLGSSQNWTIFRGHFYAFYGLFLSGGYSSNIFGVLEIPDIFFRGGGGGVNGKCWARAYVWKQNESTPPPP